MAITNARIQVRRGLEKDFDPDKMSPGEWAVSTDTKYVRICFSPGVCVRMATYEAFEADMQEIQNILATCQDIQKAVDKFEGLAEQHAATAQSYSIESKSWSDSAKSYSEEATRQANLAKTYAEKASEVTEIDYATQDRAGIIKGGENHIAEDGTLEMTKRTTDRTLYNSYAGGIKINEVTGKSEQRTTTGKNLFNEDEVIIGYSISNSGIQTANEVWNCTDYIIVSGGNTVIWCSENNPSNSQLTLSEYTKDKTFIKRNAANTPSLTVELESDVAYVRLGYRNDVVFEKLQFEYGNVRTSYEPYTGGIPSPNPDYPQEIKSVEVGEIKSVGKNIFNINDVNITNTLLNTKGETSVSDNWLTTDYIKIKPNTTYSLSIDDARDNYVVRFLEYNLNKESVKYVGNVLGVDGNTNSKIKTTEKTRYIRISFGRNNKKTTAEQWKDDGHWMQIEEGESVTEYAPYTESKITLSSPLTLRGIGDTKDRIVRKDGVWGVERNVAGGRMYGTTNGWVWGLRGSGTEYYTTYNPYTSVFKNIPNTVAISNAFQKGGRWDMNNTGKIGVSNGQTAYVFIGASTFASLDELVSFLDSNEVYIYSLRANSVYEELPEADQIALHTLQSFDTVTYISTESEIEPVIDLEYGTSRVGGYTLEAWNNAENNKIMLEELTTAMLVMNQ